MNTDVKKLTYASLLTALALVIPLVFGAFLKIQIPPFTATLGAHVPMFLAMLLGPLAAIMVGLGSALGFFMTSQLVVAARAFMHTFVGLAGALLIKKGVSFNKVIFITAFIHGGLEALAVIPFGFTMYKVLIVVGVGSILHHFADGALSVILVRFLSKALNINFGGKKIA